MRFRYSFFHSRGIMSIVFESGLTQNEKSLNIFPHRGSLPTRRRKFMCCSRVWTNNKRTRCPKHDFGFFFWGVCCVSGIAHITLPRRPHLLSAAAQGLCCAPYWFFLRTVHRFCPRIALLRRPSCWTWFGPGSLDTCFGLLAGGNWKYSAISFDVSFFQSNKHIEKQPQPQPQQQTTTTTTQTHTQTQQNEEKNTTTTTTTTTNNHNHNHNTHTHTHTQTQQNEAKTRPQPQRQQQTTTTHDHDHKLCVRPLIFKWLRHSLTICLACFACALHAAFAIPWCLPCVVSRCSAGLTA